MMATNMGRRLGDAELARRLGAYAAVRLAPDAVAMARVRANVLASATSRATEATPIVAPLAVERARRRASISPFRQRRLRFEIGLAAALVALLIVVGGAAAAQAGGPLYGARLWVETLTLPTDPSARTDAELNRLTARLQDARDAAARGDGAAVQAALQAYQATVDEALDVAGSDSTLTDRISLELQRHLAVLSALVDTLPDKASATLQRVLAQSEATIQRIEADHEANPGAENAGGGGNGGAGASATNNAEGNGSGAQGSPRRSASPSPQKSPKPTTAATAAPTPTPTDTPVPSHGGGKPSPSPSPDRVGGHPTPSPHSSSSRP
jgi:hypothetical protein